MKSYPALRETPAVRARPATRRTPPPQHLPRTTLSRRRTGLEGYLRRGDTLPARFLSWLTGDPGPTYARSGTKRVLDLAAGIPLAVVALPVIVVLSLVNAILEPGRAPFFSQKRAGTGMSRLRVVKIRSMAPAASATPREIKRFARFMRRHYLDELPQVFQVLAGELSLVGIRVLPVEVCDNLKRGWSADRFNSWRVAYSSSRLGLTGVHQVFRGAGKEDLSRYHRDLFYQRNASLGLDLYLMWRTLRKAGR